MDWIPDSLGTIINESEKFIVQSLCKCSSSNANTQNHDELHKFKIAIIAIDEYAILRFLCRCMYNSCISIFKMELKIPVQTYFPRACSYTNAFLCVCLFVCLFVVFFFGGGGGLCWHEFINPVQLRMECEHIYITSKHVMCSTGCKCTCFSSPMSIAPIKLKYPRYIHQFMSNIHIYHTVLMFQKSSRTHVHQFARLFYWFGLSLTKQSTLVCSSIKRREKLPFDCIFKMCHSNIYKLFLYPLPILGFDNTLLFQPPTRRNSWQLQTRT